MATLAGLLIPITGDASAFKRAMTDADRNLKSSSLGMNRTLAQIDQKFDGLARSAKRSFGNIVGSVFSVQTAIGTLVGTAGLGLLVRSVARTSAEFETLKASLKTVTGSAEAADKAFAGIKDFASTTPFSLQQATQAFIKLKALGLDPSRAALESYGNTASAMGKQLNDFIEAVADAATGEFERLKEFGIRASSQGDQVAFTFQGMTTTVAKNAAEIEGYLRQIGQVQFAGAMDEQAKTLTGAISNLSDNWEIFKATVGESGVSKALQEVARSLGEAISGSENLAQQLGEGLGTAIRTLGNLLPNAINLIGALAGQFERLAVSTGLISFDQVSPSSQIELLRDQLSGLDQQLTDLGSGLKSFRFGEDEDSFNPAEEVMGLFGTLDDYTAGLDERRAEIESERKAIVAEIAALEDGIRTAAQSARAVAEGDSRVGAIESVVDVVSNRLFAAEDIVAGLRDEYDKASSAAAEFANVQKQLAEATAAGAISQSEANRLLELARGKLLDVDNSYQKAIETQQKALAATSRQAEEQQRLLAALQKGEMAHEQTALAIEIENAARSAGIDLLSMEGQQLRANIEARYEAVEAIEAIRDQRKEDAKAAEEHLRDAERQAEEYKSLAIAPFENALESIQSAFSDTFKSIFSDGIDSFKDLGKKVLDIMQNVAGEIATLMIFRPQALSAGLSGIFGGTNGAQIPGGTGRPLSSGGGGLPIPGAGGGGGFLDSILGIFGSGPGTANGGITDLFGGSSFLANGAAIGIPAIAQLLSGGFGTQNLFKTGGSVLGGLAGSFFGGPIGASIGSLLGGFLGSTIGSLFSKSKTSSFQLINGPEVTNEFDRGLSADSPFGKVGVSRATSVKGIGIDAVQQIIDQVAEADKAIAQFLDQATIERITGKLEGPGAGRFNVKSFDNEPFDIFLQRYRKIVNEIAGKDVQENVLGGIARSVENIDQIVEAAAEFAQFIGAIRGATDDSAALTQAEEAIKAINAQFDEFARKAQSYGLPELLDDVAAARQRELQALTDNFDQGNADFIAGIREPLQFALAQFEDYADELRRNGEVLNADMALLEERLGLERQEIIQRFGQAANDSLRALLEEIRQGDLGGALATDRLAAIRANFTATQAQASAGDADARNRLAALGRDLLELSREVFASSSGFQGDKSLVLQALEGLVPGFAGGTRSAPGGVALVGEEGPELVRLPSGAQVFPNGSFSPANEDMRQGFTASVAESSRQTNRLDRIASAVERGQMTDREILKAIRDLAESLRADRGKDRRVA